jgi:hypothetical protein
MNNCLSCRLRKVNCDGPFVAIYTHVVCTLTWWGGVRISRLWSPRWTPLPCNVACSWLFNFNDICSNNSLLSTNWERFSKFKYACYPRSPSIIVQYGPASTRVRSTTLMWDRGSVEWCLWHLSTDGQHLILPDERLHHRPKEWTRKHVISKAYVIICKGNSKHVYFFKSEFTRIVCKFVICVKYIIANGFTVKLRQCMREKRKWVSKENRLLDINLWNKLRQCQRKWAESLKRINYITSVIPLILIFCCESVIRENVDIRRHMRWWDAEGYDEDERMSRMNFRRCMNYLKRSEIVISLNQSLSSLYLTL